MPKALGVVGLLAVLGVVVFGLYYGFTTPPTLGSLVVAVVVVVVAVAERVKDRP